MAGAPRSRARGKAPPAERRLAGADRLRTGARHLHAGAGFDDRQCLAATIAGNLGSALDNSTWVSTTCLAVANGVALPLTGWLMGKFGVVRTFCVSVFLFTVASFLCGIAWNLSSLIGFRILQGAVSGR